MNKIFSASLISLAAAFCGSASAFTMIETMITTSTPCPPHPNTAVQKTVSSCTNGTITLTCKYKPSPADALVKLDAVPCSTSGFTGTLQVFPDSDTSVCTYHSRCY